MQVVELARIILALSIEVLIGVIFAQLMKATSGEKTAWPGFHGFVVARKLYRLIEPMYLGVLALTSKGERCRC